ncbi:MAG TPA: DUF3891 family protein [Terriglobales bacterium]|nr:DUF3891 family protein [Terriglobales bacterium]
MVLRPIGGAELAPVCVPVWDAILPTQKASAPEYWLITQPDHAALSGDIAAALGPPLLPQLSPEVIQGIASHDDGWTPFDAQMPVADGRPLSFLDFLPKEFLRAWSGSIEHAEKLAPIAGAMVSGHFSQLARNRLESGIDGAEDRGLLLDFLEGEQTRQRRLLGSHSREEFEFLTDVLQFCDVLSLYLCCGAVQDVEFRQGFGAKPIRLRREAARSPDQAAVCHFEPSPFAGGGVDLAVIARRFPLDRQPSTMTLPFLLW